LIDPLILILPDTDSAPVLVGWYNCIVVYKYYGCVALYSYNLVLSSWIAFTATANTPL